MCFNENAWLGVILNKQGFSLLIREARSSRSFAGFRGVYDDVGDFNVCPVSLNFFRLAKKSRNL